MSTAEPVGIFYQQNFRLEVATLHFEIKQICRSNRWSALLANKLAGLLQIRFAGEILKEFFETKEFQSVSKSF